MATYPWQFLETNHYFGSCWTPTAKLPMRGPDGRDRLVWFIIDSGAVHSIVKYAVGQLIGLSVDGGIPFEIRGVGGAVTTARVHVVPVDIDGRDLDVPLAVAETNNVPNLLGRYGVFDRIDIRFDHRKKRTRLGWRL